MLDGSVHGVVVQARKYTGTSSSAAELTGVFVVDDLELAGHGRVGDILVAARLVELMGAEAGAVGRRIRLDGVTLVKQTLVVDFLQKVPESLDVAVVVGDVRIVHIDPVSHALSHVPPLFGVLHHLRAAGVIVLCYSYLRTDVGLGDSELLLDTEFNRKTVGVPAGAAVDLVAALCLVPADGVLDGAGHHMVDSRLSVCRRRAFKEYELRATFPHLKRFFKRMVLLPPVEDFIPDRNQIQSFVLFECHNFFANFASGDKSVRDAPLYLAKIVISAGLFKNN